MFFRKNLYQIMPENRLFLLKNLKKFPSAGGSNPRPLASGGSQSHVAGDFFPKSPVFYSLKFYLPTQS